MLIDVVPISKALINISYALITSITIIKSVTKPNAHFHFLNDDLQTLRKQKST